jgi:outer membrane protein assembly factor BamB
VRTPFRPFIGKTLALVTRAKQGATATVQKEEVEAVPGLEDISSVDSLTLPGKSSAEKSDIDSLSVRTREDKPEELARRLNVVQEITAVTERVAAAARNQAELGSQPASFVYGSLKTDDPEFGPWYGFQALPERDGHPNAVPADAGADGPQLWLNVENWRILGPFRGATLVNLHIPDIIDTENAIYQVVANSQVLMSGNSIASQIHTPETNSWRAKSCEPVDGTIRPLQYSAPRGHELDHPGLNDATFYVATTVWAEKDMELWAGVCVDDAGQVWVNERLACSLPGPAKGPSIESVGLFKIKLRKGRNTILARIDNERNSTGLWLRLCVRGKPRSSEEAKAQMAAARERAATLKAVPDTIRGWRGNWSGVYPNATPPLAWDLEKRINVLWRIRTGGSKGGPIVAGDKLLVTSEPMFLMCLDKMTGKILWEREMNVLELKDPKLFAESRTLLKPWKDAETELRALENDPASATQQVARIKELGGIVAGGQSKWWSFVYKNAGILERSAWGNYFGMLFATPVTDGKHVWVKCAAGVTACFDLDGNRKWMVQTEYPYNRTSMCSSPVLIDDKLIFELSTRIPGLAEAVANKEPVLKMVCYDAPSGKLLWEAQPVYNLQNSSTPVPMRLTNGKEDLAVVVTGGGRGPELKKGDLTDVLHLGGTVVRADDGKILIGNLGVSSGWSSPVVVGDLIYHIGPFYSTCTRLVMVNRDVVGAIRVWTQDTPGHDSGVVANDDILSGLDGGQWPSKVHFYEQATGVEIRKTANQNTIFGKFARGYSPPSAAGSYVFVSDDGTGFGWTPRHTKMFVVQAGRNGRLVSRNKLDSNMIPSPTFDGDRMYARSAGSVTCIAYTGDEGRFFEAETVAKTIMEDIPPSPPKAGEEKIVNSLPNVKVAAGQFAAVPAHATWHFVGPYPASESNSILKAMGGPALEGYIPKGTNVPDRVKDLYMDTWNNLRFSVRATGQMLDLTAPIANQDNTLAIYYWVFEDKKPHKVRVTCDRQDVDLWISGVKVESQDRLNLSPGRHVVMIRFITPESDTPPPQALMDLQLTDSTDPQEDIRAGRESVESNRAILERVIKLRPESEAAKEAKLRLSQL